MQRLEELIQSASFSELGPTLEVWPEKDKRAGAKWLQVYWKVQRAKFEREFLSTTSAVLWAKLCIANIALARAPGDVLRIPMPQTLTGSRGHYHLPAEALHALFAALAAKGVAWLTEYMLLATRAKRVARQNIPVAVSLIAGFGLPWSQVSEFYTLWAEEVSRLSPLRRRQERYEESVAVLAIDSATGSAAPLRTVAALSYLEAVRALPAMDTLLFGLLARRDGILDLLERYSGPEDAELKTDLVAGLAAGGQVDRAALVDALLVALTRGDSVSAQRFQARLLAATATEVELLTDHHNALLSLLASAHGSAAAVAQTLLTRADEHRALESGLFVGACEMVFARKEKGLRDAQLAWASKRFAARAEQATETMSGVFAALAIDELAFQKKVVALILKHWSQLDAGSQDTLRAQLAAYREVLDAGLYLQLNEALGVSDPSPAHDMVSLPDLPNAPIADLRPVTRFSAPPASAAALRELQAQFPHQASVDTCEQLICVALELAATDRHALELGLHEISDDFPLGLLGRLQLAAFDSFDPNSAVERSSWDRTDFARIVFLARCRYHEIASAIQRRMPYPLISRPDYSNGAIDAASLTARLDRLARRNQDAPPMDFLVALLRTRQPDQVEIAALRAVGSTQTRIAADFFAAGGLGQMQTSWHEAGGEKGILVSLLGMAHPPNVAGVESLLPQGFMRELPVVWEFDHAEGLLTSVLPDHAEILASLALGSFLRAVDGLLRVGDIGSGGGKAAALALPVYLAARGPAGPALHLAVLLTLSASDAAARLAGSDGLLELIGQGRYDCELACRLIAECVKCGYVKVTRLAKSLTPLVDAGAAQAIWPLLRAAVQSALEQDSPPPGTPDLLALAARVVGRLGIHETIAVLACVAARRGGSKLLTEARRLNELLNG